MVTRWGLSERLGPLTYSDEEGEVFLGHSVTQHKKVSDQTQDIIDEEVRRIIDRNYQRSSTLLKENEERLHAMAEALIRYETINVDQIKDVMEGREPRPPRTRRINPRRAANPKWSKTRATASSRRPVRLVGPRVFTDRTHGSYPTPPDATRRRRRPMNSRIGGATHPVAPAGPGRPD